MSHATEPRCSARAYVAGRVQGVWFRGFVQRQARQLGLAGWARNLPDGRVEVLFTGGETAIAELTRQLHIGPPLSRVDRVEVQAIQLTEMDGFTIK